MELNKGQANAERKRETFDLVVPEPSSEFMNAHPQPGLVNVLMLQRPGCVSADARLRTPHNRESGSPNIAPQVVMDITHLLQQTHGV